MPSSYQAPTRGDKDNAPTVSQSVQSNMSAQNSTVATLLDKKGNDIFSVRPNQTIETVVMLLRDKRIGAVLVTDDAGNMVGILSERDIVRRMADTPGQTLPQKVEDLMTSKVVTCTPSDQLIGVLRKMTDGRFRHMPVTDNNGQLLGLITIGDVVNFRLNELEYEALRMKQMIVG
ncbi:MAG: CBS domain-containing protein [Pseudomonadota bacterium]